jgi:hypothetical protein
MVQLSGAGHESAWAGFKEGFDAYKRKDYATAYKELKSAAEQGNANAQFYVGQMYERGLIDYDHSNVKESNIILNRNTLIWYNKSAKQGHVKAQVMLGFMYYWRSGIPINKKLAVKWFRKAAEQGDPQAQHLLGGMYEAGLGVLKNYKKAAKWYRKSAEQGRAVAQDDLGRCYREGLGVLKDYKLAVGWFREGAKQGFPYSQNNLGLMYRDGKGV